MEELEQRLVRLRADLYQACGKMSAASLDRLVRRIHITQFKIYSFKGGRYGKNRKR